MHYSHIPYIWLLFIIYCFSSYIQVYDNIVIQMWLRTLQHINWYDQTFSKLLMYVRTRLKQHATSNMFVLNPVFSGKWGRVQIVTYRIKHEVVQMHISINSRIMKSYFCSYLEDIALYIRYIYSTRPSVINTLCTELMYSNVVLFCFLVHRVLAL